MQEESILQIDDMATNEVASSRETNSLPLPFVAGRVEEVSEIVGMLSSGSSEASASVSVLSIVGMGGLGKTTLAKSIYNNPAIDGHFAKKIWVFVSDKFEATELFRLILESLKGEKVKRFGQDGIVKKIREELRGTRFFLILDDVWNEDQKLWDDFFTTLVGLNATPGSWCLVTTRSQKVANLVSTFPPLILKKLRDDECWQILCRRAAKYGEMPQQLDVYKEEIVKICQGLPLAANAIGGFLSLQKREDWLSIVEEKILMVGEYLEAGRDEEVSEIVDTLLLDSSKAYASVSVLSIVGMGGVGKTTLAESVYNNPDIDRRFDKKMWVFVSDKFEVTELFRLILESLKGEKVERLRQDVIVQKIREELGGKRFLLILDDVWNEDPKLWDDFFTTLVGLNTTPASWCLVTTRSQKVANLVSTFPPFVLKKLRDDGPFVPTAMQGEKERQKIRGVRAIAFLKWG